MLADTLAGGNARLEVSTRADATVLSISGRLDSKSVGSLWSRAVAEVEKSGPATLIVEASGVTYCDISGVGLLVDLRQHQAGPGRTFKIEGLREEFGRLLDLFRDKDFQQVETGTGARRRLGNPITALGRVAVEQWQDSRDVFIFIGQLTVSLTQVVFRRARVRWRDMFLVAEGAGVNALPICCAMGLILGLIVSFQAAVPLKRYAGEILVADMVVLAMFREMGPLFTAIIIAGRSGSAFAAEIGTMKVSEEVDALTTMGLDPVPFLVLPRVLAGMIMTPLLTVFTNIMGLVGGGVVFLSLGFTAETYWERITVRGDPKDFVLGLFRAVVFGVIIAAVGCRQGITTGTGARAVGESTTRSVVSSIILVIVADGLMAVMFYAMGL